MTDISVETIFSEYYIGALATINEDGSPRSTPLHVVSDGEYAYWLSKPDKVHSQNIDRDNRVSLSLASSGTSKGLRGVYLNGRAEHLPKQDQDAVYQLLRKRLGEDKMPPKMEEADAYRLKIGVCDEQKSTFNCWYFYS